MSSTAPTRHGPRLPYELLEAKLAAARADLQAMTKRAEAAEARAEAAEARVAQLEAQAQAASQLPAECNHHWPDGTSAMRKHGGRVVTAHCQIKGCQYRMRKEADGTWVEWPREAPGDPTLEAAVEAAAAARR